MMSSRESLPSSIFVPGEVLALLTPLQEMEPGLYLVHAVTDGWAILLGIIDDEASERILVTNDQNMLPVALLDLFTPVGLRLTSAA